MSQYDNYDNPQRDERRSSGWSSASKRNDGGRQGSWNRSDRDRGDRQGSWGRDDRGRGGSYRQGRSWDRDRDDRRGSWSRDGRPDRRDDRRDRDRDDRRGSWDRDDRGNRGNWGRRDGERRNWDRDDRRDNRGSRDRGRDDRRRWDRDDRGDDRREGRGNWSRNSDRRSSWNRDDRSDRRDGNWNRGRDDRHESWNREDRRGDRGNWNRGRDDRRDNRGSWDRDRHGRPEGSRRDRFDDDSRGASSDARYTHEPDHLEIPESISADALDAGARKQLRSLNKDNAERVARHLVYAGEMLEIDPEVAYEHARAAYKSAARIDVVREALGLTAYATGRYSEALRELRTYRRMSDDYTHVPLEADSERGLGRPEKALRFIDGIPLQRLKPEGQIELALVTSGARAETGNSEGGLSVLEKIIVDNLPEELAARVQLIKADRLEELGRTDEAEELRATWAPIYEDEGGDIMVDLDEVLDDAEPAPVVESDEESSGDETPGDSDDFTDVDEAGAHEADFESELEEELAEELAQEVDAEDLGDGEAAEESEAPQEADGDEEREVADAGEVADVVESEADASAEDGEFVQDDLFGDSLDAALEEDQELDLNEEDE